MTGIALNHTEGLRLDERFVSAPWLLDWYGIEAPPPGTSFASGNRRATLVGQRLYLDGREVARDLDSLIGIVAWRESLAVATSDAVLLFDPEGRFTGRAELAERDGPIETIGAEGNGRLIVAAGGRRRFAYDERSESLLPAQGAEDIAWSEPSAIGGPEYEEIARAYRGDGVTVARLLYDVHSGRLLGNGGKLLMDAVGVLLILLGVTGIILWLRGRTPTR